MPETNDPETPLALYSLGDFRVWLTEQSEASILLWQGHPVWMEVVRAQAWEFLFELIHEPVERLDLNAKNEAGQGWLHLAIVYNMPDVLVGWGMARLNGRWWEPDFEGRSPFELAVSAQVAQRMAVRWWGEGLQNSKITPSVLMAQARAQGRMDLVRVWSFWMPR